MSVKNIQTKQKLLLARFLFFNTFPMFFNPFITACHLAVTGLRKAVALTTIMVILVVASPLGASPSWAQEALSSPLVVELPEGDTHQLTFDEINPDIPEKFDLFEYFLDPEERQLVFSLENDQPAVLAASVEGSVLSLKPLANGRAQIRVIAAPPDGPAAVVTFTVSVQAEGDNATPILVEPFADKRLFVSPRAVSVELASHFIDPEGQSLQYQASSSATDSC